MTIRHRTVEQLIEEQAHRWQLTRAEARKERKGPVITVSRQVGAQGDEVAERLAKTLGLDLFDRELIHQVAESAHLSERVVSALDEKDRSLLTDWMTSLATPSYLSQYGYLYHLTRVVGAIARHGGAVIVGRGCHLILRPGEALRVRVVAPIEARVASLASGLGLSDRDARHRIEEVEAERRAFFTKSFHATYGDPEAFDLVVNTQVLGVEGAVEMIQACLARLPEPVTA
jgi:cytidylate kinase